MSAITNQPYNGQPDYGSQVHPYGNQVQPYGNAPPPFTQQPAGQPYAGTPQITLAPVPAGMAGVPPGLEYLASINQLVVKQVVELLEVFTGFETNNKYRVFNSVGQQVYFAAEDTETCMRLCCGSGRAFTIHITDNYGKEVMRVQRDFKCCAGCCWCAACDCCAHELQVEAPPGQVIGYVRQERSGWIPYFSIRDQSHAVVASIKGPCCICKMPCCGDVQFPVYGPDETTVIGSCAKQWTGLLTEYFTDADTFCVTFPQDMDVRMKATMFGALFLIDFMFFEDNQNDQ